MAKTQVTPLQKMLNIWALVLIFWSVYRTYFSLPEFIDEILIKPVVFVFPVIWYIKNVEKQNLLSALWIKKNGLITDIKYGFVIGLLFWSIIFIANFFKNGSLNFAFNLSLAKVGYLLLITTLTAITEEILSRGFVVKRLFEDSKNYLNASFLGSILFIILHIPIIMTNYKLTGNAIIIYIVTEFFLSIIISLIYLERKSLLPAIIIHALYNLAILLYI